MKEINLVSSIKISKKEKTKASRKINFICMGIIFVFCLSTAGLWLWSQILLRKTEVLDSEIKNYEVKVNKLAEREILIRNLKFRLSNIQKILSSRMLYPDILENIAGLMPEGMYLTELSLGTDNKLTMAAAVKDSQTLSDFVTKLIDPETGGKHFVNAVITSLVFSKEKSYNFTLTADIR